MRTKTLQTGCVRDELSIDLLINLSSLPRLSLKNFVHFPQQQMARPRQQLYPDSLQHHLLQHHPRPRRPVSQRQLALRGFRQQGDRKTEVAPASLSSMKDVTQRLLQCARSSRLPTKESYQIPR